VRTQETDRLWLKRQCYKEYNGIGDSIGETTAMASDLVAKLRQLLPRLDVDVDRHDVLALMEKVFVEFRHYCLFADCHDLMVEAGGARINANTLEIWPEEDALASRRRAMIAEHGKLGANAVDFTEGGYCTLYSEGAALQGRPGIEGRIGAACQRVYDDEFGHMMHGYMGINAARLDAAEWEKLGRLTVEQLKLRILMRNAQFSFPLAPKRVAAIFAGDIEPMKFDFDKAATYV
jgi:hypothetical protein